MKSLARVLLVIMLGGIASPAASQRVTQPLISGPQETGPGSLFVADTARPGPRPLTVAAPNDARWNAAFLGAVAGAVVGGLVGVWAEKESQDGIAPPAYYFSVPLGAVVGFVVGLHLRDR